MALSKVSQKEKKKSLNYELTWPTELTRTDRCIHIAILFVIRVSSKINRSKPVNEKAMNYGSLSDGCLRYLATKSAYKRKTSMGSIGQGTELNSKLGRAW